MNDSRPSAAEIPDTVWREKTAWIDQIPQPIAIVSLVLAILAVWQAVTMLGIVSPIILPSPARTAEDLVIVGTNLLTGGYMLTSFLVTAREVVVSFAIATLIGGSIGILVGATSFGERALMPVIVAIDTMPKVAFAPLFLSWLGFGIASKVALATFIALFPIIVGAAAGLHAADANARMLFKSIGATPWQTLVQLKIPTGLPHFFTGLKIAAIGVVGGAVTGELVGGGKGFGELIRIAATQLDTPRVFSLICYLSLMGLATFGVVAWIQRRFIFWHRDTTIGDGSN